MADLKITQLPSASIATGSNVLPIVQGGTTDQITVTNLGQGIFNLNLPLTSSAITNPSYIDFNLTASVTQPVAGRLSWNNSDGTLDLGMKGGNVTQQIGEEIFYEVRNETGTPLDNGTSVYASGVTAGSGRITAAPFTADGSIEGIRYLGLATEDISNGVNGFVTHFGYVRDLDTRGNVASSIAVGDETWAAGDILYAHPTVPGKLTKVKPQNEIVVCIIIVRNQTAGVVFVRPYTYGNLSDLNDTSINTGSLATGDLLTYNSGSNLWVNSKQLTGSYGLTGSLNATSFTGSLLGTASYATNHAVITSSYVCDGILNANQTFATGSDATIAFVDYIDPNNWLANNQFKPTIAGYYSVSFGVWLQNPGIATNQVNTQMRKNGNSVIISQQPLNNGTGIGLGGSRIIQMNGTTDYLDWTIFQGTAGSGTTGTILQGSANGQGTWFSAFLLTQ